MTTTYKEYTIKTVGISRYIYRPGTQSSDLYFNNYSDGYAQSMAAAKRWINEDIKERRSEAISKNVVTWGGLR